jgi:DNA-binding IclR family transcriptional regulator
MSPANGWPPRAREGPVPGLDRGLSVLELLARRREPLRAAEMAGALGVPPNSLGRILQTLAGRGYLDRSAKTKSFALTPKLLALGSAAVCEADLLEAARDALRDLRDATGEMVQLNARLGTEGVVLDVAASRHPVRMTVDPGTRFTLHDAAGGKVAMAFAPAPERERLLAGLKLVRRTPRTIASRDALRRELEAVRRQGYALDRAECVEGIRCVSAPVFDRRGDCVAALTLTGPSMRIPESRFPALARAVVAHAGRISRRLGAERPAVPGSSRPDSS